MLKIRQVLEKINFHKTHGPGLQAKAVVLLWLSTIIGVFGKTWFVLVDTQFWELWLRSDYQAHGRYQTQSCRTPMFHRAEIKL